MTRFPGLPSAGANGQRTRPAERLIAGADGGWTPGCEVRVVPRLGPSSTTGPVTTSAKRAGSPGGPAPAGDHGEHQTLRAGSRR